MKSVFIVSVSVIALSFSFGLQAEVVSGRTSMGCEVSDAVMGTPSAPESISSDFPIPQTCANYSGEWKGGCLKSGAYPTNWPTRDGYVVLVPLRPTSEVTAAPHDGVDPLTAELEGEMTLKITQDGCQKVSIQWNELKKDTLFAHRTRVTQSERFTRACYSGEHRWRRTYDFLHQRTITPLWRDGGRSFRVNDTLDGLDANYQARYLRTLNRDFVFGGNHIRINSTLYSLANRFDPPAFEFAVPSVGADICIFKKVQ